MTTGKRLKFIRNFRKVTQKELGIALGFEAGCADIRISQYESDSRKSIKEPMLHQMAEILNVNYAALKTYEFDNIEDILESFFWFEEEFPSYLALFEFQPDENTDRLSIKMPADIDGKSIEAPVAFMFAPPEYRKCFNGWLDMKRSLRNEIITKDEYIEWKLQWSYKK